MKKNQQVIGFKNEIESSDVTVNRIALKKMSNAKSVKKTVMIDQKVLQRKKSVDSFKMEPRTSQNGLNRRETHMTLKADHAATRPAVVESIKIQKECVPPKSQELRKFWSKRDFKNTLDQKISEREYDKLSNKSHSKSKKRKEMKSKSIKPILNKKKSEKSMEKNVFLKHEKPTETRLNSKDKKTKITLQKSKSVKSIHDYQAEKNETNMSSKEVLLEGLMEKFKSKINELDRKVSYLYQKNQKKEIIKNPKLPKKKEMKKVEFEEDQLSENEDNSEQFENRQKMVKKDKKTVKGKTKGNFSKKKQEEVVLDESNEKLYSKMDKNAWKIVKEVEFDGNGHDGKKKITNANGKFKNEQKGKLEVQKFNLTNILKIDYAPILCDKNEEKKRPKNQIADIRTIINFSRNKTLVLKEILPKSDLEKLIFITKTEPDGSSQINSKSPNIICELNAREEKELSSKRQKNLSIQEQKESNKTQKILATQTPKNQTGLNSIEKNQSFEKNYSNYKLLEKESWKMPSPSVLKRHSKDLVLSNFSNKSRPNEIFQIYENSQLFPLNSLPNLDQSYCDTKRTQDFFKQLNTMQESFHAPVTSRSVFNNSKSMILTKPENINSPSHPVCLEVYDAFDKPVISNHQIEVIKKANEPKNEKPISLQSLCETYNQIIEFSPNPKTSSAVAATPKHSLIESFVEEENKTIEEVISNDFKKDETVDLITHQIFYLLLNDLFSDSKFNLIIYPEKTKGLNFNLPYVKLYTEELLELVKVKLSVVVFN